jgi:hypothetical protein
LKPLLHATFAILLAAAPARAQSIPGAVLAKREPHHHLVYEDSTLRVLRVHVPAHDTTLLHEHDPDYFWIALGASTVVNAKPGAPDATIASGNLSIHYTVGNFAHVARNPSGAPFDNITVELLAKQTNVHNLCEAVVAGQPLTCSESSTRRASRVSPDALFAGATEHPAFSTDQLRVSLLTIPPGASMRPTGAARRAVLIALDSADAGRALRIVGSGRWIGGTFRPVADAEWQVRNSGKVAVRALAVVP